MVVVVDDKSGFCYGVQKTIKLAEDTLAQGKALYCLGEIVHNEEEVARLREKGMNIIGVEDLDRLNGEQVLIRAHGEPPSTYEKINHHANVLFEGTCPIVTQLQKKVKAAWEEMEACNGLVLIYGKKGHAEVVGLAGQTKGNAIVVEKMEDLEGINFNRPIALFAQTTQPPEGYQLLTGHIREKMSAFFTEPVPLKIANSICGHVSKRGEHLAEFSKKFDVVIFVSGSNSSNGKVLLGICKKNNERTHWVSSADELHTDWFKNAQSVGICGATSTPQWLMDAVAQKISKGF